MSEWEKIRQIREQKKKEEREYYQSLAREAEEEQDYYDYLGRQQQAEDRRRAESRFWNDTLSEIGLSAANPTAPQYPFHNQVRDLGPLS